MKKLTIAVGMFLGLGFLALSLAPPAVAEFCTDVPCAHSQGVDRVCCPEAGGVPTAQNICGAVDDTIGGCIDESGPAGCIPALLGDCGDDAVAACDDCGCATHSNPGC